MIIQSVNNEGSLIFEFFVRLSCSTVIFICNFNQGIQYLPCKMEAGVQDRQQVKILTTSTEHLQDVQ